MLANIKKHFGYYFLVLAIIELSFIWFWPEGRLMSKPLLLLTLMAYYFMSSFQVDWLFLIALFFAFLGDTLLLFEGYFLYGLGSFLVMQVLYAICFFKQKGALSKRKYLGIALIILLTISVLYTLAPNLSSLIVPVVVYSCSIAMMAIGAILRNDKGRHYYLILLGVLSFLVSDSLLGLNKFSDGFPLAGLLVMSTYILAQYLIVTGYLNYERSNIELQKT